MNRRAGFALVAAGGAFGTLGRYAVMRAFPAAPGAFPWGTLAVNLVGAAAIGVLAARGVVGSRAVGDALLGAGFLGAFTTFSALAVETVLLVDAGRPLVGGAYLVASVAGGIVACAAAWRLGRPGCSPEPTEADPC